MPRLPENLTHHRFGRLTVVKQSPSRKAYWVCQCDCGAVRVIRTDSLQQGRSLSCGCYRNECSGDRVGQPKPRRYKRRTKPKKTKPQPVDWI